MSTAIRTVASGTDDPLDAGSASDVDSDPDSRSTSIEENSIVENSIVQVSIQDDSVQDDSVQDHSVEASAQAMLREALRLLPRSALEPVLLASCSWYRRLPAAAARACLADVDAARHDGDPTPALRDWCARAEPFQR